MFERAVKLYRHINARRQGGLRCSAVSVHVRGPRAHWPSAWGADELAGSQQSRFLDIPLGGEVLESGRAVLPGQVLVELVLQGVQTVAVARARAKLGDVEAGSVGHVDHEGVGEDH